MNKKTITIVVVSMLMALVLFACWGAPRLPNPQSTSGVYEHTGYEYIRWEDGLELMVLVEGAQSSGCHITSDGRTTEWSCQAQSCSQSRYDWLLTTTDGINADFTVGGRPYYLKDGNVFFLAASDGQVNLRQLKRDLSMLPADGSRVTEFSLADAELREMIQTSPQVEACFSTINFGLPPADPARIESAKQVLVTYFKLLHAGEYGRASTYYGGDYESMSDHNPGIAPDDYAALFEKACTVNGAQCLQVGNITFLEQPTPNDFHFSVQFSNEDGSTFERGPCCGEDGAGDQIQDAFVYTVRIDCRGKYVVMELPVYRP